MRVIRLLQALSINRTADVIGKQPISSATSVKANYQSACRGESTADVITKLSLVGEEADESLYWMELIVEIGLLLLEKSSNLMSENIEILASNCINKNFTQKIQNLKSKI